MSHFSDVSATGLDRETHICVVIPGFILLTGLVCAGLVVAPARRAILNGLEGLQRTTWLAEAVAVVVILVAALGLGYLNRWMSDLLYRRATTPHGWAWRTAARRVPEALPYCAVLGPSNLFHQELREQVEGLAGPVADLHVVWNGQRTRAGLDVAADLMVAWFLTGGGDRCEQGWSEVRTWRERSNLSVALSFAFPASLGIVSAAGGVLIAERGGWAVLLAVLPLAGVALAYGLYRWFVVKAILEWTEGQNLLSRLFWASQKQRVPSPMADGTESGERKVDPLGHQHTAGAISADAVRGCEMIHERYLWFSERACILNRAFSAAKECVEQAFSSDPRGLDDLLLFNDLQLFLMQVAALDGFVTACLHSCGFPKDNPTIAGIGLLVDPTTASSKNYQRLRSHAAEIYALRDAWLHAQGDPSVLRRPQWPAHFRDRFGLEERDGRLWIRLVHKAEDGRTAWNFVVNTLQDMAALIVSSVSNRLNA